MTPTGPRVLTLLEDPEETSTQIASVLPVPSQRLTP
jgi:hypothetical protein